MKRLLVASLFCVNLAVAQTSNVAATAQQPAAAAAKESTVVVVIETSLGPITAELYPDKAPITVSNFLAYADDKFYDGTVFHRVMRRFMIQGGGFTTNMLQKATKTEIKNEAANGLKNDRGTLAMARRPDPDSASSQFFINHANNASLNKDFPSQMGGDGYGYAVFGKVTDGMDVVDKIAAVQTTGRRSPTNPFECLPLSPMVINSIRRQVKDAPSK